MRYFLVLCGCLAIVILGSLCIVGEVIGGFLLAHHFRSPWFLAICLSSIPSFVGLAMLVDRFDNWAQGE